MQEYALIVAGGSGTRMNAPVPKQFLPIGDKPILMHTILAFQEYSPHIKIILVLPASQFPQWDLLCQQHHFISPVQLIAGGNTRFQSVKNGLKIINEEAIVAIHDGVRPFIDINLLKNCFVEAKKQGNAVVAVPLKESIREISEQTGTSVALARNKYRLIQTPQTFYASQIKAAYNCEELETLTDDASVAELAGIKINLIEGSYRNIKITTQEDLLFAETLLTKNI